eukprot:9504067-Pyramimonas_sp.AAC.2
MLLGTLLVPLVGDDDGLGAPPGHLDDARLPLQHRLVHRLRRRLGALLLLVRALPAVSALFLLLLLARLPPPILLLVLLLLLLRLLSPLGAGGSSEYTALQCVNITSFYGSSCANNGKGALNTP